MKKLQLLIISPRAARLLLSQQFWWERGERSLLVGIPTDTSQAPTMGPCRAIAAKEPAAREQEGVVRQREGVESAAKRAAIASATDGPTNSGRLLARAREAPPREAHFLQKTAEANRNRRGTGCTFRPTRFPRT